MGKKKRPRNTTVYGSVEGKTEAFLLECLKEVYSDMETMRFPDNPLKGGSPDRIVDAAIKNTHYDRAFAWFDEDLELSLNARLSLAKCWMVNSKGLAEIHFCPLAQLQKKFNSKNRKPILIVSHPVCVESLILKILGKKLPYETFDPLEREKQIGDLKNALKEIFSIQKPLEYYRDHLTKDVLEERRREIPELDLLIKLVSK